MARKETPAQQATVGRVMHEYKHGELRAGKGGNVRNPRQAIAIALSEAGLSNEQSPQQNKLAVAHTRAELYERAKREGVPGRSKMNKAELKRVLDSRRH